jgi:hypothetical protein
MRKLTIALGITTLSIGAATQAAPDAGGWCVDFRSFCDGLQLYAAPDGVHLTGTWENWDCAGSTAAINGNLSGDGVVSVVCGDFATCPIGFIWLFKFERASSTFDMYGWDGVNPPFQNLLDSPYALTPGTCNFTNDKTGIPSSLAR